MSSITFKPLLAILPLVFVLLVSGCTSPITPIIPAGTAGGVSVVDFYSDFADIYSGESVKFNLMVQNTGSVEADHVFAELLGLDEDWFEGSEKFPNEAECRYDGNHFSLLSPKPEYNVRGEIHVCTWTYDTPEGIPKGMSVTYEATARVYYNYQTGVMKSITLMSYSKMKELQEQGNPFPSDTLSQTSSPVSITATARSPIRIFGNERITFPLEIVIENTGGGVACQVGKCKKSVGNEWNEILISIGFSGNNMNIVPGSGCEQFMSGYGAYVSVWPGKSNKITCDIEVVNPSQITGPEQRSVRIHADYSYFIEKSIPITVSSPY